MSVRYKNERSSGFTLIELMITLALVGIIASFAVPSFANLIANSRLASTSNDVVGLLNYARAEAVKSGRVVLALPLTGSDWSSGLRIGYDNDGDGSIDDEIRRIDPAPGSVTVSATSNLAFTGGGLLPNGASTVTVQVCDDRSGENGSVITVTLGGRIRSEDFTCG